MESMVVISGVDKARPWCAGMVVVWKKLWNIRICVDLKPLNERVLREVHPMPRVDRTFTQVSRAKVFIRHSLRCQEQRYSQSWMPVLAFSRFHFSEQSHLLATFLTPMGRFCFNKLPTGISRVVGAFPEMHASHIGGTTRSSLPNGRYPHSWEGPSWAWCQTTQGPYQNEQSWSNT